MDIKNRIQSSLSSMKTGLGEYLDSLDKQAMEKDLEEVLNEISSKMELVLERAESQKQMFEKINNLASSVSKIEVQVQNISNKMSVGKKSPQKDRPKPTKTSQKNASQELSRPSGSAESFTEYMQQQRQEKAKAAVQERRSSAAQLIKNLDFNREYDDPVFMLRKETDRNFKKVFDMLDKILANMGGSGFNFFGGGDGKGKGKGRGKGRFGRFMKYAGGGLTGILGGFAGYALGTAAYDAVTGLNERPQYNTDALAAQAEQLNREQRSGNIQRPQAGETTTPTETPTAQAGETTTPTETPTAQAVNVPDPRRSELARSIEEQKDTVKLEAGREVVGAAGAVGGTVAVNRMLASNTAKSVWKLFLGFVKKKAPALMVKLGVKLAAAAGLAAIPFIGWIGAAIQIGFTISTAWDLYQLWKEFSKLSDAEKMLYDEVGQEGPVPNEGMDPEQERERIRKEQAAVEATRQQGNAAQASAAAAQSDEQLGGRATASSGAAETRAASTQELKGVSESGTAKEALQFFQDKGWSKEQSAGIVANLMAESGLNMKTDASGDQGTAYGIAQWRGDRQTRFKEVYGKPIQEAGFKEQLEYVNWELNNSEARAGTRLRGAKTAPDAAAIVDQYYERSSGEHRQKRLDYASQLMDSSYAEKVSQGASRATSDVAQRRARGGGQSSAPGASPAASGGASPAAAEATPAAGGGSVPPATAQPATAANPVPAQAVNGEDLSRRSAMVEESRRAPSAPPQPVVVNAPQTGGGGCQFRPTLTPLKQSTMKDADASIRMAFSRDYWA